MTPRPRWRVVVGRLSLLYLAGILFLVLAQAVVGDQHWLAAPLVYAPKAPLLLPPTLLALVALAGRSWRAAALNVASIAACALWLMHLALPFPSAGAPPAGTPLRVMTFNIHFGAAGVPAVARAIRAAAPDLVFLQEVKAGPGVPDPAPTLRRELADWRQIHHGEYLIAGRFPLRQARTLSLGSGLRTLLTVEAEVGARRVTLYDVHFATAARGQSLTRRRGSLSQYLTHTAAIRQRQAEALAGHLAGTRGPVLIAGDFNSPPGSHCLRALRSRFTDAFAEGGGGFGFTFPNRLPLLRIDYLFASPDFRVGDCRVVRSGVSDHRAVVADLVLRK